MADDSPSSTSQSHHKHHHHKHHHKHHHHKHHHHHHHTRKSYTTVSTHTPILETRTRDQDTTSRSRNLLRLILRDDSSPETLNMETSGDSAPQVVALRLKRLKSDEGSSTTAEEASESLEHDSSGYVSCSEGFPPGGGASDASEAEFPPGKCSLRFIRDDLAPPVPPEPGAECHGVVPLVGETETRGDSEKASSAEARTATASLTAKNPSARGEGDALGREGTFVKSGSSSPAARPASSPRPLLTRARPLFSDDDLEASLESREEEAPAVRPKSGGASDKEEPLSPYKARRARKKACPSSSSSLSLENPLPEIAEDPHQHVVVDLHDDSDRSPFVSLSLGDDDETDKWDHEELSMKFQADLESLGDKMASRYIRSKGIRLPSPRRREIGETVVNINENELGRDNDRSKLKKSFSQSYIDEVRARAKAESLGHDNQAFVDDEQDAVSRDENVSDPLELPRRSSDPEVSAIAKEEAKGNEEQLFRSASCGTELDKVLNNLSGETSPAMVTPILRKRSISRTRQDSETDDTRTKEETPETAKYGDKKGVRLRPTFYLGSEENSPSMLSKFVKGSPSAKLRRSESTKSHMGARAFREEGLSRSTSNIFEGGTKIRGGGTTSHHSRPLQSPQSPSISLKGERRSEKGYLLQQHLYRNSRRSVQQKLHRQLSDFYYNDDSSRYSDHVSLYSLPTRLYRDASPSRHSHSHHSPQHHRSQSQRHHHRPRHEPLRRLNTYGHEQYHKYVQEHEQRYALEHPYEQDTQDIEGQELASERRLSHYRQEEKGKTDVERWVGVHGGQPSEGTQSGSPLLNSPPTPHIVVSPEDNNATSQNNNDKSVQEEAAQSATQANNGAIVPNGQSAPAPPPTPSNNAENNRARPDKLTLNMNTLDLPDSRHPSIDIGMRLKTRRNSMSEMLKRYGSQTNLQRTPSANNIRRSTSRNSLVLEWRQEGNDSLIACLSALYGKLLVVMGMAFPIAEVISHDIPVTFYNGFYLYLYVGSIIFLVYAYVFLLRSINLPTEQIKSKFHSLRRMASRESHLSGGSEMDKESDRGSVNTMSFKPAKYTLTESNNHGSMYLKMGAVLFGIGSMIYSGLEVGQYFELKADDNCADILLAIAPGARMLFTFIQMYFIFLNSRVAISRHRIVARFGLMHMIGTNLCIWLNVLVQETKHEIINLKLGHGEHHGGGNLWAIILNEGKENNHHSASGHHGDAGAVLGHHDDPAAVLGHHADDHNNTFVNHTLFNETAHAPHDLHDLHKVANDTHNIVKRASSEHHAFSIFECRRSDLMGELVDNASPFLFPCTIEYSLLCAGVLYVIWKNINKPEVSYDGDSDISTYVARKARHHYSVDCAHANRGLFMGILVLVLTIISLILFFVLINNEDYKDVAIMEANIIELSVYSVASITVVIGMIQMRELEFIPEGDIELDNILLLIAQTGVYIYTSFTVIGGHFATTNNLILPLLSSIITLIQTTLQTLFILDASRRCCYNHDQLQRKPGREMVTFLLVCNLAMWAINTFETSRADAHPTQLNFYGIWAWTIISHISMPLAIFYRFHVTVCLCEIWKRSYKLKHDY